jgi:hypothetical protein
MELCGTPVYISLAVDILPSTQNLNFLSERRELISLITLLEIFNLCCLSHEPG